MRTPSPELVRLCLKPPASRCEPPPPHPRFAEEKEIKSFGLWQPPGAMAPRAQRVPQPRVCPQVPGGLRGIAQTSSTLWLGRLCGVQRAPPFPPSASGRIPGAGPTPPATPAARPPAGRGRCPRPPRTTAPGVPCPAPPRPATMGAAVFFGCAGIAFGPALALVLLTVAAEPLRVIVLVAG